MLDDLLALARPALFPPNRLRAFAWLVLATLATLLFALGSSPLLAAAAPNPPWDKLAHAGVFAGFGFIAWVASGARTLTVPLLIVACVAVMDEGLQYFTPGRNADLRDIVADLAGAWLAVLVLRGLQGIARGRDARLQTAAAQDRVPRH